MHPATEITLLVASIPWAFKTIYEMVLLIRSQMASATNRPTVYCNYPLSGGGCAFASHDFHIARTAEIVAGIKSEIDPVMKEQNTILRDIRDGVRDLNKGRS